MFEAVQEAPSAHCRTWRSKQKYFRFLFTLVPEELVLRLLVGHVELELQVPVDAAVEVPSDACLSYVVMSSPEELYHIKTTSMFGEGFAGAVDVPDGRLTMLLS